MVSNTVKCKSAQKMHVLNSAEVFSESKGRSMASAEVQKPEVLQEHYENRQQSIQQHFQSQLINSFLLVPNPVILKLALVITSGENGQPLSTSYSIPSFSYCSSWSAKYGPRARSFWRQWGTYVLRCRFSGQTYWVKISGSTHHHHHHHQDLCFNKLSG